MKMKRTIRKARRGVWLTMMIVDGEKSKRTVYFSVEIMEKWARKCCLIERTIGCRVSENFLRSVDAMDLFPMSSWRIYWCMADV